MIINKIKELFDRIDAEKYIIIKDDNIILSTHELIFNKNIRKLEVIDFFLYDKKLYIYVE